MEGRVGKKLPYHAPGMMEKVSKEWSKVIRYTMPILGKIKKVTRGLPFDEWVQPFPPSKRELFKRLLDTTEDAVPIVASSFIKREKATKYGTITHGSFIPLAVMLIWKDPRFIQGCPPELSLATGPHIRRLAKNFSKKMEPTHYTAQELKQGKHIVYTCGKSAEQVGACLKQAIDLIEANMDSDDKLVYLEDDQSRFDLHMTQGPFRFLNAFYKSNLIKRVRKLLKRGQSAGRSVLGTTYKIPYTMQSGWPDTAIGDTAVNSSMKLYIHGIGYLWVSIVCGDDSITVTTAKEIARVGGKEGIVQKYANLGMEIEAKVSDDVLDTEFCSGMFRPVNGSYVLFPKIGSFLAKILHDMKERTPEDSKAWLRGIAATCDNFGVIDPLCKALSVGIRRNVGEGRVIYETLNMYKSWPIGEAAPLWEEVLHFYSHRYGFSQMDLLACVDELENLKLGVDSQCPLLTLLCETDC